MKKHVLSMDEATRNAHRELVAEHDAIHSMLCTVLGYEGATPSLPVLVRTIIDHYHVANQVAADRQAALSAVRDHILTADDRDAIMRYDAPGPVLAYTTRRIEERGGEITAVDDMRIKHAQVVADLERDRDEARVIVSAARSAIDALDEVTTDRAKCAVLTLLRLVIR